MLKVRLCENCLLFKSGLKHFNEYSLKDTFYLGLDKIKDIQKLH